MSSEEIIAPYGLVCGSWRTRACVGIVGKRGAGAWQRGKDRGHCEPKGPSGGARAVGGAEKGN